MAIKFITFWDNQEFTRWQFDHRDQDIIQVSPITMNIDLDITEHTDREGVKSASGTHTPKTGIFVVFRDKPTAENQDVSR